MQSSKFHHFLSNEIGAYCCHLWPSWHGYLLNRATNISHWLTTPQMDGIAPWYLSVNIEEMHKRPGLEQKIWEQILDAFAAHDDIDFAYPTQRFYHNETEGKPGTRPGAVYPNDEDKMNV